MNRLTSLLLLCLPLIVVAQSPADEPARPQSQSQTPVPTATDTAPQFVPGIYYSVQEFLSNAPRVRAQRIDGAMSKVGEKRIAFVAATGKRASVNSMDIWGYSDGIGMFVRAINPRNPKDFGGFFRLLTLAQLSLAENPLSVYEQARMLERAENQSSGNSNRPAINTGINVGMGMGMGYGGYGGFGIGSPGFGWGRSPWWYDPFYGPYGYGYGPGMSGPSYTNQRPPSNQVCGSTGIPAPQLEKPLFFIYMKDGLVRYLDGIAFPAFLRQNDPELFEAFSLDERPAGDRKKLLEFYTKFNRRHPLAGR